MAKSSYVVTREINSSSFGVGKPSLLGNLDIELTERCNNNCVHCYINLPPFNSEAGKKEITCEGIKKILKEAESLGCRRVRFTGGEPFLRKDFEELYIFARKIGLRVLIFTNATLITPRLADLFVRIPPLEKIEITVYGMKKSSYEGVTRTAGSFKLFQSGVKLLLEKKIPFLVKAALLPQNREEIDLVKKWAMTIPGMNRPPLFSFFFNLRRRGERRKNILIKKLRLSGEEGFKILLRNKKEYIKEMKDFSSKFMYPTGDKVFSCGAGRGGGCVDAYGRFQPCLMLRSPECSYDLKIGSLRDALENFFPKLREKKALNSKYLKRCAKCFLKGFCEQCPARSWEEHGTLDTPVEYCCEVAHALARSLGLLKNEEKGWEVSDYRARIKEFVNNGV